MAQQSEKEAKYMPYCGDTKRETTKRKDDLKLEDRFECQPEYRKAYLAYLTRENMQRLPRPLAEAAEAAEALQALKEADQGSS